ncbi:hypothetical protein Tco_1253644 [Tanacetum coccineum]
MGAPHGGKPEHDSYGNSHGSVGQLNVIKFFSSALNTASDQVSFSRASRLGLQENRHSVEEYGQSFFLTIYDKSCPFSPYPNSRILQEIITCTWKYSSTILLQMTSSLALLTLWRASPTMVKVATVTPLSIPDEEGRKNGEKREKGEREEKEEGRKERRKKGE